MKVLLFKVDLQIMESSLHLQNDLHPTKRSPNYLEIATKI